MRLKKPLSEGQTMSQAIADACEWARFLVNRESRGPGDRDNAIRRVAGRHGLPHGFIWTLLYRPPRDLLMSKYEALREAYSAECERQANALRHEFEITQAKSLLGKALVRAAASVACEDD